METKKPPLGKGLHNLGHGYVYPRADGGRAGCGGPAICKECALDYQHHLHEIGRCDTGADIPGGGAA